MTLTKRVGLGSVLSVDTTGGTTFVALGAIVDSINSEAKAKDVNTALLTDTFDTFLKGSIDPGTVTFTIAYDPSDTSTTEVLGTLFASTSQTLANWQITFAAVGGGSAAHETFLGYVSGLTRAIKKDEMITCNVTIKVSGDPGYSHS